MSWNTEEGWADLTLIIESVSLTSSGRRVLVASGTDASKTLRIEVSLPSEMRCGLIEQGDDVVLDQEAVYHNGVEFRSVGVESDQLLGAMARAYGVPAPSAMKGAVRLTCIVLEGDSETMRESVMKCKLFYDEKMVQEDNDEDYCELFLNIDLAQGTLEIAEKDMDYRANVIRALGAS